MKKGLIAFTIFLCIIIGGGIVWANSIKDKTGPEISFPSEEITYKEGNQKALLEGVSAIDDINGDVSDSIRINGIFPDEETHTAKVVYIAKDKSNNISKATREVIYATGEMSVDDGGDIEESAMVEPTKKPLVAEQPQEAETTEAPDVSITPEVTTTPALSPGAPRITLTDNTITINRGESINRLYYVEDISDDKDDRNELYRGIQIAGEVDTTTPGEYEVIYHVVDSDGNRSNDAKLVVKVN